MGDSKIVERVVNHRGRAFNARLVRRGDRYGLNDCLVHDKDEPLVEFWDATYEHDPRFTPGLGQFVSRYFLSTLIEVRYGHYPDHGLDLCGHEPAWKITGKNVAEALAAVRAALTDAVDPAEALRELRDLVGTYLEGSDDAPRAAQLLNAIDAAVSR